MGHEIKNTKRNATRPKADRKPYVQSMAVGKKVIGVAWLNGKPYIGYDNGECNQVLFK